MSTAIHLINGLLGSGKTTLLQHLLTQKPENEHWAVLVNEFGSIDIDAASLKTLDDTVEIAEIRGGCLCCTGQVQMNQALQTLLAHSPNLDRIWIEASGLGHPAQTLDLIHQLAQHFPIERHKSICVITPKQLTETRWQKSEIMRNLVTLADIIILNQCDLCSEEEIQSAQQLLQTHKPNFNLQDSLQQVSSLYYEQLIGKPTPKFIPQLTPEFSHLQSQKSESSIPEAIEHWQQWQTRHGTAQLLGLAWRFPPDTQFQRTQLQKAFIECHEHIARLKGILKTGKEWQKFDWTPTQTTFQDIAWRQDSRLECLVNPESFADEAQTLAFIQAFEQQLAHCIYHKESGQN